jgi:hypothetical protein
VYESNAGDTKLMLFKNGYTECFITLNDDPDAGWKSVRGWKESDLKQLLNVFHLSEYSTLDRWREDDGVTKKDMKLVKSLLSYLDKTIRESKY